MTKLQLAKQKVHCARGGEKLKARRKLIHLVALSLRKKQKNLFKHCVLTGMSL